MTSRVDNWNEDLLLDDEAAGHAVEVAPRIWWVGDVLDDPFQCHAYLVEAGTSSVLIDPGSTLTIETTLRKIEEVVPIEHVKTIVVHHVDPDVSDGLHLLDRLITRDDAVVLTEWRSGLLLRHLALELPWESIEDHGWCLPLDDHRELQFLLTPYLHFPGAFVSFEPSNRVLFSADLFGGFNRAGRLWAAGADAFEDLRQFHEHYMPSRELLMVGLASITEHFAPITTVLPQHGYLIARPHVEAMFQQLSDLECGVMLQSRSDEHLSRLLDIAASVRRIGATLDNADSLDKMEELILGDLGHFMPAVALSFEAETPTGEVVSFARTNQFTGEVIDRWSPSTPDTIALEVPRAGDDPRYSMVISLSRPATIEGEAATMLAAVAHHARRIIAHAVESRGAELENKQLLDTAQHDPLTGLLNRRALDEFLDDRRVRTVVIVDIDHFKMVNDTFGHSTGDEVLRRIAGVLTASVRPDDVVVRFGGEEMLVVAPGGPITETTATALAERIRAAVAALDLDDTTPGSGGVTVSAGVTTQTVFETLDDAVARADEALYAAKNSGRNRVVFAAAPAELPV